MVTLMLRRLLYRVTHRRPDRIKALVNMSVVWFPRNPALNPVEESRALLANLSTEQGAHCFFTRLVLNKLISCSLIVPIG
ncbi:hypothetical protein CFP56_013430 [Quercus suber]|uniref:Uncharacterized protein n=1 Tax=Quercus suber TaxID=58331 RepID=A0AAW0KU75_QUESU